MKPLLFFTTAMMFMVGCKEKNEIPMEKLDNPRIDVIVLDSAKAYREVKYKSFNDSLNIWRHKWESYGDSSQIYIDKSREYLYTYDPRFYKYISRAEKYKSMMSKAYHHSMTFYDSLNKYQ